MKKTTAVLPLLLVALAACGGGGDDEPDAAPPTTITSTIPRPTDEQATALVEKVLAVAPAVTEEKIVDRARNTCSSVLGGTSGAALTRATVVRFSDSAVTISTEAATKIAAIVKAEPWCK